MFAWRFDWRLGVFLFWSQVWLWTRAHLPILDGCWRVSRANQRSSHGFLGLQKPMALWHQSSLSHLVSWVVQESTRARILCCIAANASNGQAVADNQCICRHVRLCQCHLWKGCCNLQLLGRKVYILFKFDLFVSTELEPSPQRHRGCVVRTAWTAKRLQRSSCPMGWAVTVQFLPQICCSKLPWDLRSSNSGVRAESFTEVRSWEILFQHGRAV